MYIVTPGKDAYIMTIAFGSQKPHMYLTEECIEYLRAREWVDMSITDQTLTLSQAVFDLDESNYDKEWFGYCKQKGKRYKIKGYDTQKGLNRICELMGWHFAKGTKIYLLGKRIKGPCPTVEFDFNLMIEAFDH